MSNSTLAEEKTEARPPRPARRFVRAWVPVVVWLMVIALESTPFMGADHTSGPLQRFFELFHGPFTSREWWHWHMAIRKTGHVVGYGILSILFFRAFWMTFRPHAVLVARKLAAHPFSIAATFLVASADEFHQTFLPNRTGVFSDVLIDTAGALIGQILILIWMGNKTQP